MIPLIQPLGATTGEGVGEGAATFPGNAAQQPGSVGPSFAGMLGEATTRFVDSLQQAEQMSVKAIQGEGDMRAVVDSVMSAEQSLQAAVAIRDKIVSAYLEVSRIAI